MIGTRPAAGVLLAAAAGAFGSLDTALNIAFPDLVADFDLTVGQLQWVVICFVAASGGFLLPAGAIGDRVGHATTVAIGASTSAVAMLACALAPSFGWFLVARVLQGLGTATVMASAPALSTLASAPDRRERAIGVFQSAAALGLASGPLVGAVMVLLLGWRGVFWFRVPLAVALVVLATPARRLEAGTARAVSGGGAGSGPAAGTERLWTAVVQPRVVVANLLTFVANGAMFATWLLVPSLLVDELGVGLVAGGAALALSPMLTAIAAARAGPLVERYGPAAVAAVGLAMMTAGLAVVAVGGGRDRPLLLVVVALALVGAGLGLFSVPNMSAVMAALPSRAQGLAGALNLGLRTAGIVCGAAWHAWLFDRYEPTLGFRDAFVRVFVIASMLTAAAAVLAIVAGISRRRPSSV